MNIDLNTNAEQNKQDTKTTSKFILSFKIGKIKLYYLGIHIELCCVWEKRKVAISIKVEGKRAWESTHQGFWGGGNVLFLNLGDGHMDVLFYN